MAAGKNAGKTRRPAAPKLPEYVQPNAPPGDDRIAAEKAVHAFRLRWRAVTVLLLAVNTAGFWLAVHNAPPGDGSFATSLSHLFIVGALLTVACGLILPGRVSRTTNEVADAAHRLSNGTLAELTRAMRAIASGNFEAASAQLDVAALSAHSGDELGRLAASFNRVQSEIARIVIGLDGAREGLQQRQAETDHTRRSLRQQVRALAPEIEAAQCFLTEPKPATQAASATRQATTARPATAPATRREKPTPKPAITPSQRSASQRPAPQRPAVPQFSAQKVASF